jgi:YggT family protein
VIQTIQWFINLIVQLVTLLIIAQVFLSYFLSPYHPLRQSIDRIIGPILMGIRKYVPPVGVLDFSPLVLLILVQLAGRILLSILASFTK